MFYNNGLVKAYIDGNYVELIPLDGIPYCPARMYIRGRRYLNLMVWLNKQTDKVKGLIEC